MMQRIVIPVIALVLCSMTSVDARAAQQSSFQGSSCSYAFRLWSLANVTNGLMATYQDALTHEDSAYRSAALAQIDQAITTKDGILDMLRVVRVRHQVVKGHNVYWPPFKSLSYAARHLDAAAAQAGADSGSVTAAAEFAAAQKSLTHTWSYLNRIPCNP